MAENGDKRAARTLRVAEDYEQMISTVLIGNNIVNTGSASVATVLFTMWLGADKGAAVSTVVMTIIVLIFGEVVPKNYGKANADSLAMFVSGPISVLMVIFKPLSFNPRQYFQICYQDNRQLRGWKAICYRRRTEIYCGIHRGRRGAGRKRK